MKSETKFVPQWLQSKSQNPPGLDKTSNGPSANNENHTSFFGSNRGGNTNNSGSGGGIGAPSSPFTKDKEINLRPRGGKPTGLQPPQQQTLATNLPNASVKYKLADHRYGREEMLALFTHSDEAPDHLKEHSIYICDVLMPLSLLPLSEEEQSLFLQSVNSSKSYTRGGGGYMGGRGMARGEFVERGRGRGRGRDDDSRIRPREPWDDRPPRGQDYQGYDDSLSSLSSYPYSSSSHSLFNRSNSNDSWRQKSNYHHQQQQSQNHDCGDGDDYSSGGGGKVVRDKWGPTNWREPRAPDHSSSNMSFPNSRLDDTTNYKSTSRDRPPVELKRSRSLYEDDPHNNKQHQLHDQFSTRLCPIVKTVLYVDRVPEWVTHDEDGVINYEGSFDNMGAFHASSKNTVESPVPDRNQSKFGHHRNKEADINDTGEGNPGEENWDDDYKEPQANNSNKNVSTTTSITSTSTFISSTHHEHEQQEQPSKNNNQQQQRQQFFKTETTNNDRQQECINETSNVNNNVTSNKEQNQQQQQQKTSTQQQSSSQPPSSLSSSSSTSFRSQQYNLNNATMHVFSVPGDNNFISDITNIHVTEDFVIPELNSSLRQINSTPTPKPFSPALTHLTNEASVDKFTYVRDCWYYRDPQDDIQGPFKDLEMNDWFNLGYFEMSLKIRAGVEGDFITLGEFIKRVEGLPFLPLPSDPTSPLLPTQPSLVPQTSVINEPNLSIQQQQPFINPTIIDNSNSLQQQIQLQQQHQLMSSNNISYGYQQLPLLPSQQPQQHPQQQSFLQSQQLALQQQQQQQQMLLHQQQQQQLQQQQQQRLFGFFPRDIIDPAISTSAPQIQPTIELGPPSSNVWQERSRFFNNDNVTTTQQSTSWNVASAPSTSLQQQSNNFNDDDRLKEIERRKLEIEKEEMIRKQKEEEERQKVEEMLRQQAEMLKKQEEMLKKREEELKRKEKEAKKLELEKQQLQQQQIEQQKLLQQNLLQEQQQQKVLEQQYVEQEQQDNVETDKWETEKRKDVDKKKQQQKQQLKQQQQSKQKQQQSKQQPQQTADKLSQLKITEHQPQQQTQQQQQQVQTPPLTTMTTSNAWTTSSATASPSLVIEKIKLTEIQILEQREQKEQQKQLMEQLKKYEKLQQQQQQQQQKQHKSGWKSTVVKNPPAKSLLDIQAEEQEKLMNEEAVRNQNKPADLPSFGSSWTGSKDIITKLVSVPPISANIAADLGSVWEPLPTAPFHHHHGNSRKPQKPIDSSQFPALAPTKSSSQHKKVDGGSGTGAKVNVKGSKEEIVVQKLFEASKVVKEELTEWCQHTLKGVKADVDIPTLVALLKDIESTDEVCEYIYSYLGESKRIKEFAQQFIEKRRQGVGASGGDGDRKNKKDNSNSNWSVVGSNQTTSSSSSSVAAASNTSSKQSKQQHHQQQQQQQQQQKSSSTINNTTSAAAGLSKKGKKQKMQKLDGAILGFTVHADPSRVNVGEIETVPLMHKK